ncbi:MAG TPA: hypothetical protein VGR06_08250 [Actinophytocola sp.]|nr:hypothetical protein [Actinophytocola sp.]
MKKHGVESFFVMGEGVLEFDQDGNPTTRQPLLFAFEGKSDPLNPLGD